MSSILLCAFVVPYLLQRLQIQRLYICFCFHKEWWTHLWLNEGYASFVEFLCVAYLFPEYDIWTQFVADSYIPALELDCLNNSHPIEVIHTVYTGCFVCISLTQPYSVLVTNMGSINPLNVKLNPICHLLALLGAHLILHVSRIRINFCGTAPPVWSCWLHMPFFQHYCK